MSRLCTPQEIGEARIASATIDALENKHLVIFGEEMLLLAAEQASRECGMAGVDYFEARALRRRSPGARHRPLRNSHA